MHASLESLNPKNTTYLPPRLPLYNLREVIINYKAESSTISHPPTLISSK